MMSLIETNVWEITKKQFLYKLKSYTGAFSALLSMHMIAILFSLGGVGTSSSTLNSMHVIVQCYSSDMIIAFTLIWAFIIGITITKKAYRHSDFAFVSNRFTSNLSNLLFLFTASLVGGVSSLLVGNVFKFIMFLYFGSENSIGGTLLPHPLELFLGMISTSLYIFLLSVVGYFFGILVQLHKGFFIFLPGFFLGIIFFEISSDGKTSILEEIFNLFYQEHSIILFILKVFLMIASLFCCTILISNRMEVRK